MKEYINKTTGEYRKTADKVTGEQWVPIPKWANYAYDNDESICFLKDELSYNHPLPIWVRPSQPEPLPFIDDEFTALDIQVGGDHYKQLKIQPIEFAMANHLDFCQANAIKYIVRHDSKNGKQDLEKAKHYIDLLIEHYYQ